jgi:putative transposase
MARLPRLAVGGYPHLVAHSAAARPLIADEEDGRRLLDDVRLAVSEADVALHAYALLPSGLWLLVTPADGPGLGRAMQSLGRRYVRWINVRRAEGGGLFTGRFHAAVLEPAAHFLMAQRFVEHQPVRAGVVDAPDAYRWSSARHHVGLSVDPSLRPHGLYWALGNTPFERQAAYRGWLEAGVQPEEDALLKRGLAGGWVIGSADFVAQIRPLCARRPQRAAAGRPRRLVPLNDEVVNGTHK